MLERLMSKATEEVEDSDYSSSDLSDLDETTPDDPHSEKRATEK